jgi:hypothetical protein
MRFDYVKIANMALTFNAGKFSEVVNDNFTGMNVIIDEWYTFLRSASTQYRNASETQSGGSQYLFSTIRAKLSLFLLVVSITHRDIETDAKIPAASKQIRRQLQPSVPGLGISLVPKNWCLIRLRSRLL